MTDYAPRNSQDLNPFFTNPSLTMSHYSNGNGVNFPYNGGSIPYSTASLSCSSYSAPYVPSQNAPTSAVYMPSSSSMALHYPAPLPRSATMPSHPHILTQPSYFSQMPQQRTQQPHARISLSSDSFLLEETENQDSFNEDSKLSEPVSPPFDGYPDVKEFDELMDRYVRGLSPKKQDKALIHARRAANIKAVLIDKKTTSVESAQFRFWVKKMFTLLPNDPKMPDRKKKICHEGKPVAVREKLFKILTKAHKQCQHGGRDKTSAQVRKIYSWVPKELISRFVKLCPTCSVRRGTARQSPPSEKSPPDYIDPQSPDAISPPISRRPSVATGFGSLCVQTPMSMAGFSSTFHTQNRWMTPAHPSARPTGLLPRSMDSMPVSPFSAFHSNVGLQNSLTSSTASSNRDVSGNLTYSNSIHTLSPSSTYNSRPIMGPANGSDEVLTTGYLQSHEMKQEQQF